MQEGRKQRGAILVSRAVPDKQLVIVEVEVMYPQAQHLAQAKYASVHGLGHESVRTTQGGQQCAHFRLTQNRRQAFVPPASDRCQLIRDRQIEDVTVEEKDGVHGLALGRRRDRTVDGEMTQLSLDLRLAHFRRMPGAIETDEA